VLADVGGKAHFNLDGDVDDDTEPDAGFGLVSEAVNNHGLSGSPSGAVTPLRRCAVMFLVDSNDRERMPLAAELLQQLDDIPLLAGAPLLVFAGKQDLPNAMEVVEIRNALGLTDGPATNGRHWFLQPSCSTTGDGLYVVLFPSWCPFHLPLCLK
jgi:ADP-ribosylation factor family